MVNVPPVPDCAGIDTEVTDAKSFVPVTVALPPFGIEKSSESASPSASRPVTVAVVASQSACELKVKVMFRGGTIADRPTAPFSAVVRVCVPPVDVPPDARIAVALAAAAAGGATPWPALSRTQMMPATMSASAMPLCTSMAPESASCPA